MARGTAVGRQPSLCIGAFAALFAACSGFGGANDRLSETSIFQLRDGGTEAQRSVSSGGASVGSGADWSCLDDPPATNSNTSGTQSVSYSVPLRSLFGAPLANVTTRICLPADPTCSTPLSTVDGLAPGDVLVVQVPEGFNGFLEIKADAHIPYLVYMRRPVVRDMVDDSPFLLTPINGVTQLATLLNVEVVPELALIAISAVDCAWKGVAGVTFSNDLGGRAFYFIDGLPNVNASATDSQGYGGFINVPIRVTEIEGHIQADGRLVGARTVLPRVGWVTGVPLRPASLPVE